MEAILPLLSALGGGIIGYWIKSLEFRTTELTARVDDAIREIGEIERLAMQYWQQPGEAHLSLIENELVGRLHRLSQLIAFCQHGGWSFIGTDVIAAHLDFRDAVSGPPFESVSRAATPQRTRIIFRTGTDLMIVLRSARRRLLHPFSTLREFWVSHIRRSK